MNTLRLILRRLLSGIGVLWGAATLTFLAINLSAGDPALAILGGPEAMPSAELIAQVRAGFVPQPEAAGAFGYDFRAAVEMIREANAAVDDAGVSLDTDPRRVAKSGSAQDAAQLAAIEIAATGAALSAAASRSSATSTSCAGS